MERLHTAGTTHTTEIRRGKKKDWGSLRGEVTNELGERVERGTENSLGATDGKKVQKSY